MNLASKPLPISRTLFGQPLIPLPQNLGMVPALGLFDGAVVDAGMLGNAHPPTQSGSGRPGVLDRLAGVLNKAGRNFGDLVTGPLDPRLSSEQQEQIRRHAMFQAGLQTLAAASQTPSGMGALAQGLLTGPQAALGMQENALRANAQGELSQLAQGDFSRENLQQLFQHAVATGNVGLASSIVGWANATQQEDPGVMLAGAGNRYAIDRRTGDIRKDYGAPEPKLVSQDLGDKIVWYEEGNPSRIVHQAYKGRSPSSGAARGAPRTYIDEATGQTRLGVFNPETNEFEPIPGAAPVAGAGSEGERKAAAFAHFIPDHIAFVDRLESAPGRVEQALSDRGLREFTGAEQQQLRLAGAALAEAWLRMTTGAAYNEREFETAYQLFVPQPGDRREALALKRKNRERLVGMLQGLAGRASVGGAAQNSGTSVTPTLDRYRGTVR